MGMLRCLVLAAIVLAPAGAFAVDLERAAPGDVLACSADGGAVTVAQAASCQPLNQACGTARIQPPTQCCAGLWCHNGACVNFRGPNEPCGIGNPPCAAGLSCVNGRCQ